MFYRDSIFSWFKTRTFKDNYFILHISSNGELWKPHSSTLVKYRVSIHELRKSPWWTETHKLSDTCYVLHFSVYLVYIITNDEYQGLCFKVFRAWSIDFYYLANELKNFVAIGNKYGLGCFVLYILGIYLSIMNTKFHTVAIPFHYHICLTSLCLKIFYTWQLLQAHASQTPWYELKPMLKKLYR
jgi:hypothetical protein